MSKLVVLLAVLFLVLFAAGCQQDVAADNEVVVIPADMSELTQNDKDALVDIVNFVREGEVEVVTPTVVEGTDVWSYDVYMHLTAVQTVDNYSEDNIKWPTDPVIFEPGNEATFLYVIGQAKPGHEEACLTVQALRPSHPGLEITAVRSVNLPNTVIFGAQPDSTYPQVWRFTANSCATGNFPALMFFEVDVKNVSYEENNGAVAWGFMGIHADVLFETGFYNSQGIIVGYGGTSFELWGKPNRVYAPFIQR